MILDTLAVEFKLSEQDRNQMLPRGKQRAFDNRVGWARTYLKKAELVETSGVGKVRITLRGMELLKSKPPKIDRKFLLQFPEFVEFQKREAAEVPTWGTATVTFGDAGSVGGAVSGVSAIIGTPTEMIDYNYRSLRSALADDLLERIKACSPQIL